MANLTWDLNGVRDDLLVARIDLGGQRHRLRLAQADLQITLRSPASLVCQASADVSSDARSARDGVVALRNDGGRAKDSLKIADLDLVRIDKRLGNAHMPSVSAHRLMDARAKARQIMRGYNRQIVSLTTQASDLQEQAAQFATQAAALCSQSRKAGDGP